MDHPHHLVPLALVEVGAEQELGQHGEVGTLTCSRPPGRSTRRISPKARGSSSRSPDAPARARRKPARRSHRRTAPRSVQLPTQVHIRPGLDVEDRPAPPGFLAADVQAQTVGRAAGGRAIPAPAPPRRRQNDGATSRDRRPRGRGRGRCRRSRGEARMRCRMPERSARAGRVGGERHRLAQIIGPRSGHELVEADLAQDRRAHPAGMAVARRASPPARPSTAPRRWSWCR